MPEYKIKPGDTLSALAVKNKVSVDDILKANPSITDPNRIRAGATLQLPYTGGAAPAATQPSNIQEMPAYATGVPGFSDPDMLRIARGIMEAEHRGTGPSLDTYDPKFMIRTNFRGAPGGSTAFGPGQITRSTAQDVLNRGSVGPALRSYIQDRYLPAGSQMLRHGNEGPGRGNKSFFDPTFDYGGSAGLDVESEFPMYNELFQATIDRKLRDAGVTAQQVLQGGDERNSFLSRYYAPEREPAYDTAFARGIAPVMAGQSKQNAYHANRFAAKTAADMARHVSGKD